LTSKTLVGRPKFSREDAARAWDDLELGPLLKMAFSRLEDYWEEVDTYNRMSDIAYIACYNQAKAMFNFRRQLNAE
jgi:hypothetical protein